MRLPNTPLHKAEMPAAEQNVEPTSHVLCVPALRHPDVRTVVKRRAAAARRKTLASLLAASFAAAVIVGNPLAAPVVRAEEPYTKFLEKLRDEKLYDMALEYITVLEASKNSDAEFTATMPLERALLLQQVAIQLPNRNPQRAQKLDQAEAEFNKFLKAQKDHPRRSEARLGLGNLLLARAEEAKALGKTDEEIPDAVKFFAQAKVLFDDTIKELAEILTQMKGARTEASDAAKVELRDRYRAEYRQAQLLAAYSTENEGRSHKKGSAPWKTELEKALGLYTKLYTTESDRVELRNYALFYRSGIYRDLGKVDDAIDGYTRIADITDVDPLRPLQVQSLTELIKLLTRPDQSKFPVAIEKGDKWVKGIRPDERNAQETIDFKVELAAAKAKWAEELEKKDPNDRNSQRLRREARGDLQQMARITGPHQDAARTHLAAMGIEKTEAKPKTDLPKVKNFKEAMEAAQDRIEQIRTEMLAVEVKKGELASLPADQQAAKHGEIDEISAAAGEIRSQATALLQEALRMYRPSDGKEKLLDARFNLASMYLQADRPWEAIAIGDFLARTNAGTQIGLQCATVALAGYGKMIKTAEPAEQGAIAAQLEPLAEFMVATWPDAPETQNAAGALVQLALVGGDVSRAQQYLAKLPAQTESGARLRREVGLHLAAKFMKEKSAVPEGEALPESLVKLRDQSISILTEGLEPIQVDQFDLAALEASNLLVRLLLSGGKVAEADKWVSRPNVSALAVLRSKPDITDNRQVKLATYIAALQAGAAKLGEDGDPAPVLANIRELISQMRDAAGTDEEGKKLLAGLYVSVARDLQETVKETKTPAKKRKIASGLAVVAKEVGNSSEDISAKLWSAQTLSGMAEIFEPGDSAVKPMLEDAAKTLQAILDKEQKSPGTIQPANNKILVYKELAMVYRVRGDYAESIQAFADVLKTNPSMVDLQQEAARTLQMWGDSGKTEKYSTAMRGDFPDPKLRGNTIWGWGKLSQALAGKTQFEKQFYEARYELANCLYKQGSKQTEPDKKKRFLEQSVKELKSTYLLYPSMGGEASLNRFENLLKQIQKELGQEVVGFTAPNAGQAGASGSSK